MQKTLQLAFISLLFSTFTFNQFIEASHIFESDCHEQNCIICPTGGDDKFIASLSRSENLNFKKFLDLLSIDWISSYSIKANAPIRAPPFQH